MSLLLSVLDYMPNAIVVVYTFDFVNLYTWDTLVSVTYEYVH
eukprot:SAG11_NODE_551_length_8587_cov_6.916951_2_plen_42_part_00